ncbi:2-amino-4-hydroxy-6-hydroxymethyldihydropteridine diphosphokinase [Thermodesulfobacteriota bacterium]
MEIHTAYIAVGSNIGERRLNCQNGIAALTVSGKTFLKAQSEFYLTEPVDYTDQEWFVNSVVRIDTILDPYQLLDELKSIELNAGRTVDAVKFGPRVLDLDILFYDEWVSNSLKLIVPHPRMHKRRFVLKPICDIDPTLVHPVLKKDMRSLLDSLDDSGQKIIPYR